MKREIKTQKVNKHPQKKQPTIIDNRTPPENRPDVAIRTVVYVEVGNAETQRVKQLVEYVSEMYKGNRGGIHYILPIRHGKIGADIFFEQEWLKVIKSICVVDDTGNIVLKDGAKDIRVSRETIND